MNKSLIEAENDKNEQMKISHHLSIITADILLLPSQTFPT